MLTISLSERSLRPSVATNFVFGMELRPTVDKTTWYKKRGQDSVVAIKKDAVLPPSARNLRFLRQGALLQKLAASTLRDSWAPVAPCFLGGLPACRTGDVAEVLRGVAQVAATWSRLEWRAVLGAADVHRAYDSVPLRATADPLRTMVWEAQEVSVAHSCKAACDLPTTTWAAFFDPISASAPGPSRATSSWRSCWIAYYVPFWGLGLSVSGVFGPAKRAIGVCVGRQCFCRRTH